MSLRKVPCPICKSLTLNIGDEFCDKCSLVKKHIDHFLYTGEGRKFVKHKIGELEKTILRMCPIMDSRCTGDKCALWDVYLNQCIIKTYLVKGIGVYNIELKRNSKRR